MIHLVFLVQLRPSNGLGVTFLFTFNYNIVVCAVVHFSLIDKLAIFTKQLFPVMFKVVKPICQYDVLSYISKKNCRNKPKVPVPTPAY